MHDCTTYGDIHKYNLDLHLLPQIDQAYSPNSW
jgi:hypothetical protein